MTYTPAEFTVETGNGGISQPIFWYGKEQGRRYIARCELQPCQAQERLAGVGEPTKQTYILPVSLPFVCNYSHLAYGPVRVDEVKSSKAGDKVSLNASPRDDVMIALREHGKNPLFTADQLCAEIRTKMKASLGMAISNAAQGILKNQDGKNEMEIRVEYWKRLLMCGATFFDEHLEPPNLRTCSDLRSQAILRSMRLTEAA